MSNLKINKTTDKYYVRETEGGEKPKFFANKAANKALIIAGAIIGLLIVAAIVFVNWPTGV